MQVLRCSFFSRESNLALAPCGTASTAAIESFQRNPKGGTNSSAAREGCAEKMKEVIRPIKKNWRIIGWFGRVTHIETRPVVSVSVACIYNLLSVYASPAEARNCAHRWIRSTRDAQPISSESVRCGDSESVAVGSRNLFNTLFLGFATTHVLHFFSQENFFVVIENKIHFFLVAFATDF